jgi:hypothetical protein
MHRPVAVPALVVGGVLMVVSARYGFHRDELYFIESAKHQAWGYIDNPSLTPAIGWLSRRLFGDSLFGLRVIPAMEVVALVVVVAAIARELGGDRSAQMLAAIVTATSALVLAIGHLLTTPTFDVLASSILLLVVCRLVRTDNQHWWLAVGLAVGLALENKYTVVLLVISLAIGAALTGCWRRLLSWWMLAGAIVAILIWLPQLLWQIDHGWPQLSFARALARDQGGENRSTLLPFQLVILGPPLAPLVVAGLWALLRRPQWAPIRFLPVGYGVLLILLALTGGKGYYAAGMFGVIIAAASIATRDWIARGRSTPRLVLLGVALGANAALAAVITLPLLPPRLVDGPIGALNEDAKETIGWPSFVDQIAAVADTVPIADRSNLVIFTADYGEAGAIDRYGPARGLGRAYSGHNSYGDFGTPPATSGPVLVVGYDDLDGDTAWFSGCHRASTVHTIDNIDNQVNDTPIWLCTSPTRPWSELWPSLRHQG